MSKPMSDEELAGLRRIAHAAPGTMREFWREEGRELLAEVDRLRAALARVTDDSMAERIAGTQADANPAYRDEGLAILGLIRAVAFGMQDDD